MCIRSIQSQARVQINGSRIERQFGPSDPSFPKEKHAQTPQRYPLGRGWDHKRYCVVFRALREFSRERTQFYTRCSDKYRSCKQILREHEITTWLQQFSRQCWLRSRAGRFSAVEPPHGMTASRDLITEADDAVLSMIRQWMGLRKTA